jgi:hypothetical protein
MPAERRVRKRPPPAAHGAPQLTAR